MNVKQLKVEMANSGLDAVVAITPENVLYSTGAYIMTQKSIRDRLAISIFDHNTEPTFIVCIIEEQGARMDSWIKDVRTYVEFKESPIEPMAAVLQEKGLGDKRIGIEKRYLSTYYYEELVQALPKATFVECAPLFDKIRMIKCNDEIEILENASIATRKAIDDAFANASAGDSEKKVANAMISNLFEYGADEMAFMVLGSGARTLIVHSVPDQTLLKKGDIVKVDFGGLFKGYFSDIARTVVVGKPSAAQADTYKKLANIQQTVIENMKPGTRLCDIYNLCGRLFQNKGLPFASPHIGHGLGIGLHEAPMIEPQNEDILKENMVLCVEPLVTFGGYGYHIEDLVLITAKGSKILSRDGFDDKIPIV